ncbi:hypothetical protein J132_08671 [Termitomyces sp. J132]|nr:hypothetical protein J132_08671 [Termitomyces sp. J132]
MPPHRIHQLYNTVAVPAFMYAADVWYTGVSLSSNGRCCTGSVAASKKLNTAQCHAAKTIMGALSTTAADMLELHANLLPINLLFHRVLTRATVCLGSLPETHPVSALA